LGFQNEVWVYLNGNPFFVDKNIYPNNPNRKKPDGRLSIQNTAFEMPLKAGENEILIGVANYFYGWGIVARLDNIQDLTLER
jgi:hypothetical protein